MNNLFLALGLYIFIVLLIAFIVSRKETKEDFLISGRDRGGWQILWSKFAGSVGASWLVSYTAYAYVYGTGVFGAILGFAVGYVIFAYWAAPRIHKHSKEKHFYTQGDFVKNSTGSNFNSKLTNIVSIASQLTWLLIGIIGGAKIMSSLNIISYESAVLLTSTIVLTYILIAGYKAVLITDIFQGLIILVLLGVVVLSITKEYTFAQLLDFESEKLGLDTALSFFIYGSLSTFAYADRYQLCYAAKKTRTLKHGIGLAIIPILFVATILMFIGIFMYSKSTTFDPDLVFIEAIKNFLNPALIPLGVVLFFAALMSTADTSVYAIASHYVLTDHDTKNPVKKIRLTTIIVMVFSVIVALLYRNIVEITLIGASLGMALSLPLIYIIANGKNPHRFTGSTIGGIIGLIAGLAILGIEPNIILTTMGGSLLGFIPNKYPHLLLRSS